MAKKFYSTNSKQAMKEGGGMIHDNRSAPCNLPTEVMDKPFGQGNYGMGGSIDDLYMGIQKQMSKDRSDLNRELSPGKY